ncbi:hypothetical protein Pcinc_026159 [Petrolisthes cinctipes]|uniref:Uncharacterized protein n=1 Tax=Petrolisthes cinctipes TaxID=88211 RepID=A0AAE1F733_PETCI|nr:hypothetical protein Pcinc_026159 [Petrolisthes cinctipes]
MGWGKERGGVTLGGRVGLIACSPTLPPFPYIVFLAASLPSRSCHLSLILCSLLPPCLLVPANPPLHCVPCCLLAFSSLPPFPYTVFHAASLPSRPCHLFPYTVFLAASLPSRPCHPFPYTVFLASLPSRPCHPFPYTVFLASLPPHPSQSS